MKGTLQKAIDRCSLSCDTCLFFRGDDPDIFYCLNEKDEFPNLCADYQQSSKISDARNEWGSMNHEL